MHNTTKKTLTATMNKQWEYNTIVYEFRSFEELGDKIHIATDKETITVDDDMLDMFLSGLIEVGAKKNGMNGHESAVVVAVQPIILQTMSNEVQSGIIAGMQSVFDELSKAQTPEKIKSLSLKAANMVKITQAVTGMARLELDIRKTELVKNSNRK